MYVFRVNQAYTIYFNPQQMSESDCRRQILTYKDDPCTEKIKTFIMAVDP